MSGTARVSLKNNVLCVESSDLLKKAKDSKSEKLINIQPFMIRTHIDCASANLSVERKTAAMKYAAAESDRIEGEMIKKIKKLVADLEVLLKNDEKGDKTACEQADKKVKGVSDELEEVLPDFGHDIRHALEKGLKLKLQSNAKSVTSGGFRGIKLIAKFQYKAASAELVKEYQEAAKSLDEAGKQAVEKGNLDKKATDELKSKVKEQVDAVTKINSQNKNDELTNLAKEIPKAAAALGKVMETYQAQIEAFHDLLANAAKLLETETKDLEKGKTDPAFKTKQTKFENVRKELQLLQKVVDKRQQDVKPVIQKLKEGEKISKPKDWQVALSTVNSLVTRFDPIHGEKFKKAADDMVLEGKKT